MKSIIYLVFLLFMTHFSYGESLLIIGDREFVVAAPFGVTVYYGGEVYYDDSLVGEIVLDNFFVNKFLDDPEKNASSCEMYYVDVLGRPAGPYIPYPWPCLE